MSSPMSRVKGKQIRSKKITQLDQDNREGSSSQKKHNVITSRVIKYKVYGDDKQLKASPTRKNYMNPNDHLKEGLRTERLTSLKNEFSENTIKRTINLQDSPPEAEEEKVVLKATKSPKSPVTDKRSIYDKTLN